MAAVRHLGFLKMIFKLWVPFRVSVFRHAKFCGDQSNHCTGKAIFRFVKMAAVRNLGFYKLKFYLPIGLRGPKCVTMPSFMMNCRTVA